MTSILQSASFATRVHRRAVCQSSPESGPVFTGKVDAREPRTWQLSFATAPRSVVAELIRDVTAFANTARDFTPPGELTAIKVLYSPPEVSVSPLSGAAADVTVTVEELLNTD